jgi:hypothetical protein
MRPRLTQSTSTPDRRLALLHPSEVLRTQTPPHVILLTAGGVVSAGAGSGQEASGKLSLSSKETMRVAQSLYEAGFITYMRTDNPVLSESALTLARQCATARLPPPLVFLCLSGLWAFPSRPFPAPGPLRASLQRRFVLPCCPTAGGN